MTKLKNSADPIVFSTEHGRICPACGKPVAGCICGKSKTVGLADGIVRIGRETKGRKGSGVTVISGVPLDPSALAALTKEFKKRCGCGGTVKGGIIEIQGDHRDVLFDELQRRGWQVKRRGG